MKSITLQDNRLHENPRIVQTDDGLQLGARFLTPSRISFVYHVLVQPVATLWRCAFFLLLVDAILTFTHIWAMLGHLPFSRTSAWLTLGILWLFWKAETLRFYPVITALFGRRLRMETDRKQLIVGQGFFKQCYSLNDELTFRVRKFDFAIDGVYQHSQCLDLVVDQTLSIPVAEIFGWKIASHIAANANMMLQMTDLPGEHDIDPSR